MELQEQISKDFMTAFKEKDMDKKNFLGVIKGEIQTAKGKGVKPTNENVLAIVKKMEKSLKQTNTEDSKRELTYIEGYLPQLMSEDELRFAIDRYVTSEGLTTPKDMGKVMGYLKEFYGGQYDGKLASTLTKQLLQ